jgi:uncharacterized damage-inducible protein DinB
LTAEEGDDMATQYTGTDEFQGARFDACDLSGLSLRDCDLSRLKTSDCWLVDVSISGRINNLRVNDVDVTDYVSAELDRRHPERVQVRAMSTADDYRAMWTTIERLWTDALARVDRLPASARDERVDDEWSFTETLRHLVFATDAWLRSSVLDEVGPYHSIGLPFTDYPVEHSNAIGLALDVEPTYAEVLAARADRMATVRGVVDRLDDAQLDEPRTRLPAPGYPDQALTVRRCLRVVMSEEVEHYRYATRDLAALEATGRP